MGHESKDIVEVIYAAKRRINSWQFIVSRAIQEDRRFLVQHYQREIRREKSRILKEYQIIID